VNAPSSPRPTHDRILFIIVVSVALSIIFCQSSAGVTFIVAASMSLTPLETPSANAVPKTRFRHDLFMFDSRVAGLELPWWPTVPRAGRADRLGSQPLVSRWSPFQSNRHPRPTAREAPRKPFLNGAQDTNPGRFPQGGFWIVFADFRFSRWNGNPFPFPHRGDSHPLLQRLLQEEIPANPWREKGFARRRLRSIRKARTFPPLSLNDLGRVASDLLPW